MRAHRQDSKEAREFRRQSLDPRKPTKHYRPLVSIAWRPRNSKRQHHVVLVHCTRPAKWARKCKTSVTQPLSTSKWPARRREGSLEKGRSHDYDVAEAIRVLYSTRIQLVTMGAGAAASASLYESSVRPLRRTTRRSVSVRSGQKHATRPGFGDRCSWGEHPQVLCLTLSIDLFRTAVLDFSVSHAPPGDRRMPAWPPVATTW